MTADEVNLYSSRHYQANEALYKGFTDKTGITINRIEGEGDALAATVFSQRLHHAIPSLRDRRRA